MRKRAKHRTTATSIRAVWGRHCCLPPALSSRRNRCILAAGASSPEAKDILKLAGIAAPNTPEALALVPGKSAGRPVLLACGYDARALVFTLLDLADRVQNGTDAAAALAIQKPLS